MWRHQVTGPKRPFNGPILHAKRWRWMSSRFGVAAGQENVLLPCGKHHIHPENYTLPSWHNDCLLSTSLIPLSKWWINCCSTLEGKREILGGGKERADMGQSATAATGRWATEQTVTEQPPRFWISDETAEWSGSRPAVMKRRLSQQCHPRAAALTPWCRSKLVKAGTRKNDIKPLAFEKACHFICHGSGSCASGSKAAVVNTVRLRWGYFGSAHRRLVSVPA